MFELQKYETNVRTEVIAGLVTFFTMAYIIIVNQSILGQTGIPAGAVILATCIAAAIGTLMMAVANVPYAQAPGMGSTPFSRSPFASVWDLNGSRRSPWCSSAVSSTSSSRPCCDTLL
ncbi:MAG: hypothetical protein LBL27_01655 [Coriobacteriales bacterium]|jgi:AGZA family xanthine/uracil permease-like MFS transporter|nr:hypothetical protein [Coriobacteriales bacterium]